MIDRNDMSFWYPAISGMVRTPETILMTFDEPVFDSMLDGHTTDGARTAVRCIKEAARGIGYPVFLRTGQGSAKHEWRDTCFVERPELFDQHIFNIVEWSHMVDIMGLSTTTWAVRKYVPTEPMFCAFKGTPINREYRVFVDESGVRCSHPYWPIDAIYHPSDPDWQDILTTWYKQPVPDVAHDLAVACRESIGEEAWSVDVLQGKDGEWYVIDMALAKRSWHWLECSVYRQVKHEIVD